MLKNIRTTDVNTSSCNEQMHGNHHNSMTVYNIYTKTSTEASCGTVVLPRIMAVPLLVVTVVMKGTADISDIQ